MPDFTMRHPDTGQESVVGNGADRARLLSHGYLEVTDTVDTAEQAAPAPDTGQTTQLAPTAQVATDQSTTGETTTGETAGDVRAEPKTGSGIAARPKAPAGAKTAGGPDTK